jgi:serine/threonine protein kinase
MPAPPTTHPAAALLTAFGVGKLDPAAAAAVARHLEECDDCRRVVAEASGDSFLGRLQAAQSRDGTPAPDRSLAGATVSNPADPFPVPPELAADPDYEIVRELGRGGMGVVYHARNRMMGRDEVLKVMGREVMARAGAADRFRREIQSAARLDHPNIVRAYSARQLGELLVFGMEYVPGTDLGRLVRERGRLPVPHACHYAAQAARGLGHAHEKGMAHRDVKPANLILVVDPDRQTHTIKVLDFGLAKVTTGDDYDPGLTGENRMLGTPDYIAPEQITDAQKADIRADVYSLGCTLYFLLTGTPPFRAPSLYDLLRKHKEEEPPPVTAARPDVPAELAAVLARMMAKDPAARFQTPAGVEAALAPFVKKRAGVPPPGADSSAAAPPTGLPQSTLPEVEVEAPPPGEPPTRTWADLGPFVTAERPVVVAPRRRRPWRARVAVALGVLAVALLGLSAAGVFKVKTKDGTIVIDNLPPDAEVVVDGETVTVSRNGQQATVKLTTAGPHRLRVMQNGQEVQSNDLTVNVGGEPVRLTFEPKQAAVQPIPPSDGPKPPPDRPKPDPPTRPPPNPPPDTPAPAAADPFAAGTTWRGHKAIDKGVFAGGTGFYELTVQTRAGGAFTGMVFDNGPNRNPAKVTGTVRGDAVEWTEVPLNNLTHKTEVTGNRVGTVFTATTKGSFPTPGSNGGRATLYRVPKAGEPVPDDFVPIFDGRSLTGWEMYPNQKGGWSVTQFGKLVGGGPAWSHLYTRATYGDLHFRARVKVNDGGDSGVIVRTSFGPVGGGRYPDGVEAQIAAGAGGVQTGGIERIENGKQLPSIHPQPVVAPAPEQWFDVDVIAAGPTVRVLVNGRETARTDDAPRAPGRIALQLRDAKTAVEFASVAVK